MKHFSAQTGGRYTYTDDIENLQALALAINSIFDGCDNFIISGCEVNGTSISPGFVYINGEIRRFAGAYNRTWPSYLYEQNSNETVAYVSGSSKVGRVNYKVVIGDAVPTSYDPITGAVPQSITITSTGGRRMKDAFFAKYALILNPSSGAQEVNGSVTFRQSTSFLCPATFGDSLNVKKGVYTSKSYWEGSDFIVDIDNGSGKKCKFQFSPENGISISLDGNRAMSISNDGTSKFTALEGTSVKGGNLKLVGSGLINTSAAQDDTLEINVHGYNGGDLFFRDVKIGDGKGNTIFLLSKKSNSASMSLPLTITAAGNTLSLKDGLHSHSSKDCNVVINWFDKDGSSLGEIGYRSGNTLNIKNLIGSIDISSSDYVNIGPAIKEDGVLLSEKYVTLENFRKEMLGKANNSDTYNQTVSDERYARLTEGLAQFIGKNGATKKTLRQNIDAISLSEAKETFPTLANFLSDMAKTESDKQKIRNNIGAAPANSYQEKLADTGWKKVLGQLNIYARQIGNIVSIQGTLLMHDESDGPLFMLPTGIQSPIYGVSWRADHYKFGAYISSNSRECLASCDEAKNHGKTTNFSLVYFV